MRIGTFALLVVAGNGMLNESDKTVDVTLMYSGNAV